jgi:hypothetical protein
MIFDCENYRFTHERVHCVAQVLSLHRRVRPLYVASIFAQCNKTWECSRMEQLTAGLQVHIGRLASTCVIIILIYRYKFFIMRHGRSVLNGSTRTSSRWVLYMNLQYNIESHMHIGQSYTCRIQPPWCTLTNFSFHNYCPCL